MGTESCGRNKCRRHRVWSTLRIALVIIAILWSSGSGPFQSTVAANSDRGSITEESVESFFDALIAEKMAEQQVVGATAAVIQGDELLFAKGYGYADLANGTSVVADETLFFPGSAGKLFTWTALMQLVEQGEISLDDDVAQYLDFEMPDSPYAPIRIENLLTHTTGFEEQLEALLVADQADLLPMDEFLQESMPARVYPPGEVSAYSNYATVLAGYIVERVSGQPYAEYVSDHIVAPLQMTRTSAEQPVDASLMGDLSQGYHYNNGEYTSVDYEWIAGEPAAPIHSTATDMAKFMIAMLNGGAYAGERILTDGTVSAMQRTQFAFNPYVYGVGYGFFVSEQNGKTIAWHIGESAHFSTLLVLIPEEEVGFFLSYNTPVATIYDTLISFVDTFYPAPEAVEAEPLPDTAERIASLSGNYVGTRVAYRSPQKLVTWLTQSLPVAAGPNDTLQVGPQQYTELEPGHFRQVDGPRTLTYRTDADGTVTQLFWGPFGYFRIPWVQAVNTQLMVAALSLLLLLTAPLAWGIDYILRRRRGGPGNGRIAQIARWTAVGVGLFNLGLTVWFVTALLGFAATYVYPKDTVNLLTLLAWANVAALMAMVGFTVLAWKDRYWRLGWRLHYSLVTVAAGFWVYFLANWNLLAR